MSYVQPTDLVDRLTAAGAITATDATTCATMVIAVWVLPTQD